MLIAYLREHQGETVLCVANLSRASQAVVITVPPVGRHYASRMLRSLIKASGVS